MKKYVLFRCFAVLLTLGILLPGTGLALPVAAESLYIRKIVSVVYDDSSSMQTEYNSLLDMYYKSMDKWANANYAMQAFCGLLGLEDRLFLTYMSEVYNSFYTPAEVDLSPANINASLSDIRERKVGSDTPYTAVQKAFDKLKSVQDDNANTQYWLVIITDGDFNEKYTSKDLEQLFRKMTGTAMPNGTKPQITFLTIGDKVKNAPSQDEQGGVYTYSAETPKDIPVVMADMADRVSGKTKTDKKKIQQTGEQTIHVSSVLPLLSITVLAQETDAVLTEAVANKEINIPIVRSAELNYPGYENLRGGAFLLGDAQTVIVAGDYDLRFDRAVSAEDVMVLYEPALEMRMKLFVNGEEVDEFYDMNTITENDTLSVSCGIYEMGTDTEIPVDRLPPDTRFRLEIIEDGTTVRESESSDMKLDSYVLAHIETTVKASVTFEGFRPIASAADFYPLEQEAAYTIVGEFKDNNDRVKYSEIAENQTMQAEFTIYADGEAITDPQTIRALNPKITVSPEGNSGDVSISTDGKVIYIPKTAGLAADGEEFFDVSVTCTAENVQTSLTYRVVIADYEILAEPVTDSVTVTEFFGNTAGVSFRIIKDGTPLPKAEVRNSFVITLNEEYPHLVTDITVASDGTITCVPSDPEEYVLNFGTWWINWFRYFCLERADVVVRLEHPCGIAEAVLPVKEAALSYQLLCVYAPLLLELLLIAAVTAYLIRYFTKARFTENALFCVASITYSSNEECHKMGSFCAYPLKQYNTFRNLWNPFRELTVTVGGTVPVTALHGGRIRCGKSFPWYGAAIKSVDLENRNFMTAQDVRKYFQGGKSNLKIEAIKPENVLNDQNNQLSQKPRQFYVVDARVSHREVFGGEKEKTIKSGTIICYTTNIK